MNESMTGEMGGHLVLIFEENGIDTSELKDAIANNDPDRIRSIMEEHRELKPAPETNRTGRQERLGEMEPVFSP